MENRIIGEILVEEGMITPEQLSVALKVQDRDKSARLGIILILLSYISTGHLLRALDTQRKRRGPDGASR